MAFENSLLHEKAYNMAMHDSLTGIANRNRFKIEGKILLENAKRDHNFISIAIFDIDHFKRVNDEFGHETGDIVLKNIARTCSEEIRGIDMIARIGGEEFVIILPKTDTDSALIMLERLRKKVESINHDNISRPVTISIGVCAGIPASDDDIDSFLCIADKALYSSKRNGRNMITTLNFKNR